MSTFLFGNAFQGPQTHYVPFDPTAFPLTVSACANLVRTIICLDLSLCAHVYATSTYILHGFVGSACTSGQVIFVSDSRGEAGVCWKYERINTRVDIVYMIKTEKNVARV